MVDRTRLGRATVPERGRLAKGSIPYCVSEEEERGIVKGSIPYDISKEQANCSTGTIDDEAKKKSDAKALAKKETKEKGGDAPSATD